MATFKQFVGLYTKYSKEGRQTHTFFGDNPYPLCIPADKLDQFYESYLKYVIQDKSSKPLGTLAEKAVEQFVFFADIDLKIEHFQENIVSFENVSILITHIKDTFQKVLSECFPSVTVVPKMAFRTIY